MALRSPSDEILRPPFPISSVASIVSSGSSNLLISWPSVPGKTYRLESSSSPAGPWTTEMTAPAAEAPSAVTSLEIVGPPASTTYFYRIALDP